MTDEKMQATTTTPEASRRKRGPAPRRPAQVYDSIEDAAAKLGLTPEALRARCRRRAVREGQDERCYFGDGVVATKFGRTWRVRFPRV